MEPLKTKSLKAKSYNLKARKGQALIEVMVAVSVLTVGFLGIVSLLSRALALNRVAAENYTATYLAAEGIEITKNIIDGNLLQREPWNNGLSNDDFEVDYVSDELASYAARPLFFDASTNLYSYSGSEESPFTRRITITLIDQNRVQVNSQVTWTARGGGTSSVELEDHFFNWR